MHHLFCLELALLTVRQTQRYIAVLNKKVAKEEPKQQL